MRAAKVEIKFELVLNSEHQIAFILNALEGAAREWASCSNDSEPLLELRDQIKGQAVAAGLAVTR